jgi:hypothetical protein
MKRPRYFDSQASAAAALGISIKKIRQAKAAGCPACRSGRVYGDELVAWFEEKRRLAAASPASTNRYFRGNAGGPLFRAHVESYPIHPEVFDRLFEDRTSDWLESLTL